MLKSGLNVIIDGQWGSTGKGKLAGYLTEQYQPDAVICDFMPNAGHTFVEDDGTKHVFKQLPVAATRCFDPIPIFVGPHAAIDVETLLYEIAMERCGARVMIHPLATVITKQDKEQEAGTTGYIAATCKGGHAANARKALREGTTHLARDVQELRPFIGDVHEAVQDIVKSGGKVLAETAQGFDLGLNHGTAYPYVTGRDCLVGRVFDNAGVSPRHMGNVIVSLRTYPIRVGNTEGGNSGPCYTDQRELTWDELSQTENMKISPETTTVTGRIRRVFTMSHNQIRRMCAYLEPNFAFLNFVNYWAGGTMDPRVQAMRSILGEYGCDLALLGTGPRQADIVRYQDLIG